MPFALVIIGMLLIVTGFQNTYKQMGVLVSGEFSGPNNFFYWLVAIGVIGALGYAKSLEGFSRAFMALIIVVIFLSNKGFFSQLNPAIQAGSSTSILPIGGNSTGGGASSAGGLGGLPDLGGLNLSDIGSDVSIAETAVSFFGF